MAKRTLSTVLETKSGELLDKWADRNKNTVWLGKKSRDLVKSEIQEALRWAYELAKRKYSKDE